MNNHDKNLTEPSDDRGLAAEADASPERLASEEGPSDGRQRRPAPAKEDAGQMEEPAVTSNQKSLEAGPAGDSDCAAAEACEKVAGLPPETTPGPTGVPADRLPKMKFAYSSGARPLDGYTIKRGVGVGGFGEVYFATSDGGKNVALKRIQRNLDVELRGVRHCLNLKHVNLIDLYDIRYDEEGGAWVIMEYVCGESLKEVLDRNPNGLPVEQVHRWIHGILMGVNCLHEHGIVHRDLKPANIFSDHDTVKIGDYGLSKFISCSRRSGQTESVGTFHYMAPEIGKGVYGKEIDVYALGIIVYELLTGRVPFDGESSQEIIMKHLTATPELQDAPAPFQAVIRRALQKDPDRRYSSATQMLEALQRGEDGGAGESEMRLADEPPARPPIRTLLSQRGETPSASPPPRRTAPSQRPPVASAPRDTFYITEDGAGDGMVFGPVRRRPGTSTAGAGTQSRRPFATFSVNSAEPWWKSFSTPLKVFGLLFLCFCAAATRSPALILFSVIAFIVFASRTALGAGAENVRRVKLRADELQRLRSGLAAKQQARPGSEHLGDLLGSMVVSAIAAAVISLLAIALADMPIGGSISTWSVYLWLTITATIGAWLVLAIGKCWECQEGDPWMRRFVMLSAGLGLGIAASGAAAFLGVTFAGGMHADVSPLLNYQAWYQNGQPMLPAYLAYFGCIFAAIRWWGQADPLRAARFSLFSTGLTVMWAWLLHTIFYFPQPWGIVLAGAVSVATQLSAPWISPGDRNDLHESIKEAA